MKIKIVGLLLFFFLMGIFVLNLRQQVKEVLPRTDEVEIVGSVYTPYLLLDSVFYFLKGWDESIDLAFSRSFSEKARIELVFANKRLLEMERLARKGNFNFTSRLMESFLKSQDRAINLTGEALRRQEDIEELTWLFQESAQDQQKIFKKIVSELPEDKRTDVLNAQKQSAEKISRLLKAIYKLDQEGF